MWTSIKEIFTKSSEIRKLKEEIQSKEDSSQKTTQLLSDTEKIKDKISSENTELRNKIIIWEKEIKKGKLNSLATDTKILNLERKTNHYDDFIRWTFNQTLAKPLSTPTQKNLIILDACIILDPMQKGEYIPLMDLLNLIEDKGIQPVIYDTLVGEFVRHINNSPDMTIFPALEMAQYFEKCIRISDKSTSILNKKQILENSLTKDEKDNLEGITSNFPSGPKQMDNDLLHTAISQYFNCPLVTEDKALLDLAKNPNRHLKLFSMRKQHVHNKISDYLNNIQT